MIFFFSVYGIVEHIAFLESGGTKIRVQQQFCYIFGKELRRHLTFGIRRPFIPLPGSW